MNDLPDEDSFARQCSPKHFDIDQEGNVWLHGSAFEPRADNPRISGLWPEFYRGDRTERLSAIRAELWNSPRTVRPSHKLGIAAVGAMRDIANQYGRMVQVCHSPLTDLPSHSEIDGIQPMDSILQQEIADICTLEDATE